MNLRNQNREDKFRGTRISARDIDKNGYTSATAVLVGGFGTISYFTEYAQNLKNIMVSPVKDNKDISELKVYHAKYVDNIVAYFNEKVNTISSRLAVELGINSKEQDRMNVARDAYSYNSTNLFAPNFRINIETQNQQWTVETKFLKSRTHGMENDS